VVVVEDLGGSVVEGEDGVVVVVGTETFPAVSGLTHPGGGAVEPDWPGMSTVPAQPKFERTVSWLTVDPFVNV
jgi:hypothetical protein